jgi:hypothetical protein
MDIISLINWPYVFCVIILTELMKHIDKKTLAEIHLKNGTKGLSKVKKVMSVVFGITMGVSFYYARDEQACSKFDYIVNLFISFAVAVFFYDTIVKLIKNTFKSKNDIV